MTQTAEFDYVIVGAGSAGCVIANRLVKEGRFSVALVERGRMDVNRWIHIPATYFKAHQSQDIDAVVSEPDETLNGAKFAVPQGRVVGGGSSVNAMIYMRGQATDYDDWEQVYGCDGWSYKDVLPVFMRQEKNMDLGAPYHGQDGRIGCGQSRIQTPRNEIALAAAQATGLPWSDDFNGETQEGVGWYQATAHAGKRQSAATCFLKPVLGSPQLTLFTDTVAGRIQFKNRRATGVEVTTNVCKKFYAPAKKSF